jgi:hypothetical protein
MPVLFPTQATLSALAYQLVMFLHMQISKTTPELRSNSMGQKWCGHRPDGDATKWWWGGVGCPSGFVALGNVCAVGVM